MEKFRIFLVWIYSTLAFLFFGGMLATIVTQYPNWTHDLPDSLRTTREFYAAATPGTFFQFMSMIMLPAFVIMLVAIWKLRKPRNLFLMHFLLFLLIGAGTASQIYPILDALFPNDATISINEANRLLKRFFLLDGIRSIVAILSCLLLILSLVGYHKRLLVAGRSLPLRP